MEGRSLKSILSRGRGVLILFLPHVLRTPLRPQVNEVRGEDVGVLGKETQLGILRLGSKSQLSATCTVTSNKSLSISRTEFDSMKHVDVSPALGEG